MVAQMDSMKKMTMTANEKEAAKMIGQMVNAVKDLREVKKQLIETIKELSLDFHFDTERKPRRCDPDSI